MINVFQPLVGGEELKAVKNGFESNWIGLGYKNDEFEKKLYNKRKLFIQQNKTLINELEKVKNWNTFANSLLTFLNKNGFLTEKQINSALKMIDKLNKK